MANFKRIAGGERWMLDLVKSSDGKWARNGKVRPWFGFDVTPCTRGKVYWLIVGGYALAFGLLKAAEEAQ